MRLHTPLLQQLGIEHPIIQAPMAGGATTVDLVCAVCEAGALGFFGAAYSTPEQILEQSREVRRRTNRPFGINLFAPLDPPPQADASKMVELVSSFHEELGLPAPSPPEWTEDRFQQQLEAVLESDATVFSFTFGTIPNQALASLKSRGLFVMATATTVDEAIALETLGVDAVVAQGSEAGAHRGTFSGEFEMSSIGTVALVPQMVDAVKVPVIASGGIMDGRGIAAGLTLGAQAAQLGTAFLCSDEAGIPSVHKEALLAANEDQTRVTRAFSGRPARGLVNRFMREAELSDGGARLLPFPLQNDLTRSMRKAAGSQGRSEFLSLWAGQGVRMSRRMGASALVAALALELDQAAESLITGIREKVEQSTTGGADDA